MRLYYKLKRLCKETLNPVRWWREVKWLCQRAHRGYADCDLWSLDYYLSGWIPKAIRQLAEQKYGIPSMVFEEDEINAHDGSISDEHMAKADARWQKILTDMAEGFEAHRNLESGHYPELRLWYDSRGTPYESRRWADLVKAEDDDRAKLAHSLELFAKYYECLWD